ncbi:MAG: SDR family oxidoreductase [Nocardioidaceae bacterium]|nr:SDR family oxidoreductase [Nocardioidaceae bacterium]
MTDVRKHALVVGAGGVIGRGVVAHFATLPDWEVTGLSRHRPVWLLGDEPAETEYIETDLFDRTSAVEALRTAADSRPVTHLVYAAYQQRSRPAEEVAPNLELLASAVESTEEAGHPLEHVTLFQGGKYYGCHLGPFKTPAKESDPRHIGPNFYFDQQDYLAGRAPSAAWDWTALRPEAVMGESMGTPMSLLMVIGVYAAISKELGLPLRFPGTEKAYNALYQVNEAELLGKAAAWAAQTPACRGEAYNITNGDAFRWRDMFPVIARAFDMPLADPAPVNLTAMMQDYGPLWDRMTAAHDLVEVPFDKVAVWGFGDFIFNSEYDNVRSDLKARSHGWNVFVDSEEMFTRQIRSLRSNRVLP